MGHFHGDLVLVAVLRGSGFEHQFERSDLTAVLTVKGDVFELCLGSLTQSKLPAEFKCLSEAYVGL